MNDIPFHTTRMGQRYYERTLPALVREITRLADLVERLIDQKDQRDEKTGRTSE
ncbi:MAG: hypothetical protein DHS20C21_00460 [Gemmatimonadota bacterium]|nr:MAG: hypothetical protein DHS20C21_00460 [Gemmatimonadota bacterium]